VETLPCPISRRTSVGRKHLGALLVAAVLFAGFRASATIIYSNDGSNNTGFITQYGNGSLASDGHVVIESNGGTWTALPVTVSTDFDVEYDVYNDSNDGDVHVILFDPETKGGIDIKNCPIDTDTPGIQFISGSNFANYNAFYFPPSSAVLAGADGSKFPSHTWTHVKIAKRGNMLMESVGGQIIRADIGSLNLPKTLYIGLGGYATPIGGAPGKISFRKILVRIFKP
jgi:hypothetical protein